MTIDDSERMIWPVFGVCVDATTQAATGRVRIIIAPVFVIPAERTGIKTSSIFELINVFSRKFNKVKLIGYALGSHFSFRCNQLSVSAIN